MERNGEYIDASSRMLDYRGVRDLYSQNSVYQAWLDIEAAVALTQSEMGIIPADAGAKIAAHCVLDKLDLDRVEKQFATVRHPLVPLLNELVRQCGDYAGKYVHWGLATQNIQQTGTLYLAKRGHDVLLDVLTDILDRLGALAIEHADVEMAGRTHGQHAVPITFGFKLAIWIDELLQAYERLKSVEKRVFTAMMGGAVGCYSALGDVGPEMQKRVAERLGMYQMALPSRSNRTHMCEYVQLLALTATSFHKIAEEVAQSSAAEYGELYEVFSHGVVGSSTMPQKVNPKLSMGIMANCQKLYGLSSMILNTAYRPFEGDACANVVYDNGVAEAMEVAIGIFVRAEALIAGLTPDLERMRQNLNLSNGLIFSEGIMMKAAQTLGKHEAHDLVYDAAMAARKERKPFIDLLATSKLVDILFERREDGLHFDMTGQYGLSPQIAREFGTKARELRRTHHAASGMNAAPVQDPAPSSVA
ncbi:adenylosuccinate lyase family protein [Telmatospirillum sp. J64-1]|uniref:class-II fumarase/aspartase family protein n=1 Tax=Telmatospirillum sp. J64-1 TaxID=2502183 RepID=UPI00115D59EE|nr:adenylosuccinate lyase family protein [Telmatospirillum sp. J64-1]